MMSAWQEVGKRVSFGLAGRTGREKRPGPPAGRAKGPVRYRSLAHEAPQGAHMVRAGLEPLAPSCDSSLVFAGRHHGVQARAREPFRAPSQSPEPKAKNSGVRQKNCCDSSVVFAILHHGEQCSPGP